MAISVQLARPDDAAGLIELSERGALDTPYLLAYDMDSASGADMLQAKLGAAENSSGCVLVGEDNGSIQAALLARTHAHPAFVDMLSSLV